MRQMILRFLAVLTVLAAMASVALGADNTPGMWKYNPAKSKAAPGVAAITNLTVTRESTPGGVKITAKGNGPMGQRSITQLMLSTTANPSL